MTVVLVIGTDTEVGKTYVTCRAVEALVADGHDVVAVKPVESGCGGNAEDGVQLAAATGQPAPTAALQRLKTPVTPALAGEREDVPLDPERWCQTIRALEEKHDLVVVETAGGVLSPMTWTYNAIDLAVQLSAQTIVVAANRLGAINHTLLTLRALDTARINTLGVVLSDTDEDSVATDTNLEVLRRLDPRPMVAVRRGGDAKAVAHWMAEA